MKEFDKEEAKQNKISQIEATTAKAFLQRVMKEYQVNLEYYQTEYSTVPVIPIGEGGVEVGLVNSDVMLWKDYLPGLFSLIEKKADIHEVLQYCREHSMSVLGLIARKYAVIPQKLKIIPSDYFENPYKLQSVFIHSKVTTIKNRAFSRCKSLKSIVVDPGNGVFKSRDNCNAIIRTATNTLIAGCSNTVIPDSVKVIGERAFEECESLTSIIIPNSVSEIGNYAFYYCCKLKSIEIPNSVTKIGACAFERCKSLTSIIIPNSVTKIGSGAFSYCSSLTNVEIPNSAANIGRSAFAECSSLKDIRYGGTKAQWNEMAKGIDLYYRSSSKTVHCVDGDIIFRGELG